MWRGAIIIFFMVSQIMAEEVVPKRIYQTASLGSMAAPKIDGALDDACWNLVEWSGGYVEWSPQENTDPSQQTQLKILYDDKNLYVAFECFDSDPDSIVERLSRRDGFDGDWVEINIDSYFDKRTAFSFTITAAGVKGEEFISDNGNNWDATWNPIWHAKTNVGETGWTAEIRIPLSQLRFSKEAGQIWGIQSTRRYFRKEERSTWQRSPLNAAGWVSGFGELHGLENLRPRMQWALKPYTSGSIKTFASEQGNPFADGTDGRSGFGLDAKVGITNDITLDATINPDFGQVEADPSAIALDGFQIFFPEQRPFFIENKNLFDYKFASSFAGNTAGFDNLFYSRRIGRAPQGFPGLQVGEFSNQPDVTTIHAAAKVSGKTKSGWSLAFLESITANEKADIASSGFERRETVEPRTNYFVGRVQKEFNARNSWIGVMTTATNRSLSPNVDFLHRSAYSGGLDFRHQWDNRSWYVAGNTVFSQVEGSRDAILRTQRSIRRLFQRVDAGHLEIDTSQTSLVGSGGNMQIGKSGGNWRFETGGTWHSPGLELNDVGFQLRADDFRQYGWLNYRTTKPMKRLRQFSISATNLAAFDFAGELKELLVSSNGWMHLNNNWWLNGALTFKPARYSVTELRGGPRLKLGSEFGYRNGIISDARKKLRFTANHSGRWGAEGISRYQDANIALTWQPSNAFSATLTPTYSLFKNELQYVGVVRFNSEDRYLVGAVDQRTLSIPIRFDWIFTPEMSLQYWGQPFTSRGRYSNFKRITDPLAGVFSDRSQRVASYQLDLNGSTYLIDDDGNGTADYFILDPDFAVAQWRSNLVFRWEYSPGSELFLVWSQDAGAFGDASSDIVEGWRDALADVQPTNIFLMKLTWQLMN